MKKTNNIHCEITKQKGNFENEFMRSVRFTRINYMNDAEFNL